MSLPSGKSSAAAVAQAALDEMQTAALIDDPRYVLRVALSALHYIASSGERDQARWWGHRSDPGWKALVMERSRR